jgi:ATP-dependent Lhr-like helicase
VLHDGEPVLYLERGGRSLQTLPAFAVGDAADAALHALADLATGGRLRSLRIERLDGVPISGSPHRERLAEAGFRASYRGYVAGRS